MTRMERHRRNYCSAVVSGLSNAKNKRQNEMIHIHIHMLVSARVWRDKQIAMPGALRSRSFWLQDCSWAQLLRASLTHYNQKVSWLTPPPGSETSRTAAFHHSRSAPLCCGLLALSLSLPSASTLALLLVWRLF